MKKKSTRTCHACGGHMIHGVKPLDFEYRGQHLSIDQAGWYCRGCGEGVHEGADIAATDKAFLEFKARVDGVLSPSEVHRIRGQLGLSQRKASEILGGGPHSFQKYESGEAAVSQPMSNLLRLLATDPTRLKELMGAADAAKRSTTAGANARRSITGGRRARRPPARRR